MSTDPSSLYGAPRPTRAPKHEISSSTTLAFTSHLSSLIAQTAKAPTSTSARARPSKARKDDIFTAHNRNTKKRALADLATDAAAAAQTHNADIGAVDPSTLHRSKRKMEEKARLYAAMKRGDYVPPSTSASAGIHDERAPLVDFDRKWAEQQDAGTSPGHSTSSGSDDGAPSDADADDDAAAVEFEDEFGRLRRGTRGEAAREERRRRAAAYAHEELVSMAARPAAPQQIIYGDTVQSGAFNPEAGVAAQMEAIARKRDRSATPPAAVHYDASKEVRTKGVGFYAFSGGKEAREREMEGLARERAETERRVRERGERKEGRRREVEERRRVVRERRERGLADRFLEGLELEGEGGEKVGGEKLFLLDKLRLQYTVDNNICATHVLLSLEVFALAAMLHRMFHLTFVIIL
ncbi:hypothetical protein MMC11_006341 [Xylographa trunciseda]|nr:hypothetical protein [Xylographa trunciseda]